MKAQINSKKAVILVSGGLDSTTCMAIAQAMGYELYALSINYGQRHAAEIKAAQWAAEHFKAREHKLISVDIGQIGGSSLTDPKMKIPQKPTEGIPNTYVPARNTMLLSFALGWAEVLNAQAIFIGVNAVDYSGYPDCRPVFIEQFQALADVATKAGVEGHGPKILSPLLNLSKADIILKGTNLGVDYTQTVSCYQADDTGLACGLCDACRLRNQGFRDAKLTDVTQYQDHVGFN